MSKIESEQMIPKVQSRCADDEVLERDHITYCSLLAFDAACDLSYLKCKGMHDQAAKYSFRKELSPGTINIRSGSIDAVRELGDANG